MMVAPVVRRHSQTRARNASRPRSWRFVPSARSCRSITAWTAIDAWSVPQIQSVSLPCIRRRRISVSWVEPFSAWPMCSSPVMFGGGNAITYGSAPLSGRPENTPVASHSGKIEASCVVGSQRVSIARILPSEAARAACNRAYRIGVWCRSRVVTRDRAGPSNAVCEVLAAVHQAARRTRRRDDPDRSGDGVRDGALPDRAAGVVRVPDARSLHGVRRGTRPLPLPPRALTPPSRPVTPACRNRRRVRSGARLRNGHRPPTTLATCPVGGLAPTARRRLLEPDHPVAELAAVPFGAWPRMGHEPTRI